MALVLTGTIVPFDPDGPDVVPRGAVYVGEDGTVDAVQPVARRAPAGFAQATRVHTGSLVFPGLIDLHNHLAYNTLPLWRAPRDEPYGTRYQWPGAATYGREVSDPAQAYGEAAAAAALRYAEVKAIVGGVTSIQGSPPVTRAFPGWMVRNVEKEKHGGEIPWRQAVCCAGSSPTCTPPAASIRSSSGSTAPRWEATSGARGERSGALSCGRRSRTCGSTGRPPTCSQLAGPACGCASAPTGARRGCATSSAS